jgi:hypothetical protein
VINDFIINSNAVGVAKDASLPTVVKVSGNKTYVGTCRLGKYQTSDNSWSIKLITDEGGGNTTIAFAEGNDVPDKIMNNYASYTYYPTLP